MPFRCYNIFLFFFFFDHPATTEIYTVRNTLSLHDALPISTPLRSRIHSSLVSMTRDSIRLVTTVGGISEPLPTMTARMGPPRGAIAILSGCAGTRDGTMVGRC